MPKPAAIKINSAPDCPQEVDRLDLLVFEFADRLRRQFADEFRRDPRAFKKRILRSIRSELPPRRGRPIRPEIEAALAMRRQGKTVREILRTQVPGFDQLDTWGRMLAEKALSQAISRRRRTARQDYQTTPRPRSGAR